MSDKMIEDAQENADWAARWWDQKAEDAAVKAQIATAYATIAIAEELKRARRARDEQYDETSKKIVALIASVDAVRGRL